MRRKQRGEASEGQYTREERRGEQIRSDRNKEVIDGETEQRMTEGRQRRVDKYACTNVEGEMRGTHIPLLSSTYITIN